MQGGLGEKRRKIRVRSAHLKKKKKKRGGGGVEVVALLPKARAAFRACGEVLAQSS